MSHSTRILIITVVGAAVVTAIIVLVLAVAGGETFAHAANRACNGHGGAVQINSDADAVVCRDGSIRGVPGYD